MTTASVREALAAVSGVAMGSDWLADAASIVGAVAIAVIAARRLSALLWRFGLSVISNHAGACESLLRKMEFNEFHEYVQDQSFVCGIDGERGDGERKLKGFFAGAIVESAPALGNRVFVALPSIEHDRQRTAFSVLA